MNTETLQNNTTLTTTGNRLRHARENIGLSQQAVAERLCLKVSTIQDIEEDYVNPNLASTFLRGYIRSYARLVNVSEEELMPMMTKQAPIKVSKVVPIKKLSLGKIHKKRDSWLMGFTWLILFVVVGLTVAWWWQNHQEQKNTTTDIVNKYPTRLLQKNNVMSAPLSNNYTNDLKKSLADQPADLNANVSVLTTPLTQMPASMNSTAYYSGTTSDNNINTLVMNFTADCWLEVFDASGKKLYSGIQHCGNTLNLTGQTPYRLKIGAPAAVEIQYQGKLVDLTQFIRSNQIARLTISGKSVKNSVNQ